MASPTVTCLQVGTYFVQQYYQILQESPNYAHQFYTESSTMTRVDGDDTNDETAASMIDIHTLLTSLNFTSIEVMTLKCQDSLSGGILVNVTGTVKSRNFNGRRKFTQAFFLAPQEKGYFVLNDIFQFIDDDSTHQNPVPADIRVDSEVHAPNSHLEQPVSNYDVEEETREYVNSLRIEEDNPVDKYSIPDDQWHQEPEPELEPEPEPETVVEEAPAPVEEVALQETTPVIAVQEPMHLPVEEPVREPAAKTWASIVRAKGSALSGTVNTQQAVRRSVPPPVLEQQHIPADAPQTRASAPQLNPSASSFVPEAVAAGTDESSTQDHGEPTSVYVRSLPSHVTEAEIEKEFKNFGRIKPNGIFIRNKKEIGVCFAFVEFEDISGVQNATKASPIQLLGRQVYIEERRASAGGVSRGGGMGRGRGRGRGSYPSAGRGGGRNPGRGSVNGNGYSY